MLNLKKVFARLPVARSTRAYEFGLDLLPGLPAAPRLLEIGTGQGYSAAWLSRRFPQGQVLSLDIQRTCLKRENLAFGPRRPDFIQATAPSLPLAAASCDAVLLVMTFHCLPAPQQVIHEAARVLRPGGWLLLADVNGQHWLKTPFEWVEHIGISPLTKAYTAGEIDALCQHAGLSQRQAHWRPGKEGGFMMWFTARKPEGHTIDAQAAPITPPGRSQGL